jgi:adenylylsulfate kinase
MLNLVWHTQSVSRLQHEQRNGHRGLCVWFTGLSGAGKSTIANALEVRLYELGMHTYLLDGDNLRHGLNEGLGFDKPSRQENVRRTAHVANLFADSGTVVMATLISPFREDRQRARDIMPPGSFIEVYVECPIDVCIRRDPKGLYAKAQHGLIQEFTGISSPYEPPQNPEVIVNTANMSIEECVECILREVETKIALPSMVGHRRK